ncbi:hypothetical protein [Burkholderia pseudomultivorans]|uniref:Uncharacterized protein n=1 Tax=Burkholderia pseudomultivorans TaxID=1207504 RepID=A0ABU2ED22_9BURK|nr:hypothetical protein [Burkholderia pseudomultivorans]MDR8731336.1 hypothetical protein [Burkholderia pseudomultivorans]MDR8738957.1 hypothetical protein [Burkholderia pseudomultivorans]MDR8745508.1 hypothetical protein [Burkholderia pseudomultivorans]MDR8757790.1 hypothetical protein [Burkholderia pseudomultivorans]MDR8781890.1 hypothetical protein [Burkholderia pseudomultivorans]
MHDLDHHLTEQTANRAYLMQTIVAHIGAIGFALNLAFGVVEASEDHVIGLLGRLGVAAFTAAVWFSGSFRANLMRQRATEGRPLELLRRPSDWLPSPFGFTRAAIGNADVQLLPPTTTK